MKYDLVTLGEVAEWGSGGTPSRTSPEYYGGDIPWIKTGDLGEKYLNSASEFITESGLKNSSAKYFPKGSIAIAMYGATIGKTSILNFSTTTNQACAVEIPNKNIISTEYLYYFIKSQENIFIQKGQGGAQPNISQALIKEHKIPLPPLPEQTRIAAILDQADKIRQKRRRDAALADEFLRSVFLEMFGDPVSNPKGWEVEELGNLSSKIGSGSTPKGGDSAYIDNGISLIRSLNVHDDDFIYRNLAHIDEIQAEKLKNVIVEKNDVLLNITGASVARCCIVPDDVLPARVNQHVAIIRLKEKMLPEFLLSLLISEPMKNLLLKDSGAGATREALTKQQIQQLAIITPPLDKQQHFLKIYQRINKIKDNQAVEDKDLFQSLSQQFFNPT